MTEANIVRTRVPIPFACGLPFLPAHDANKKRCILGCAPEIPCAEPSEFVVQMYRKTVVDIFNMKAMAASRWLGLAGHSDVRVSLTDERG